MTIGKGLFVLMLLMSAFSGVGLYHMAVAAGVISVSLPYDPIDKMDYELGPKKGKK